MLRIASKRWLPFLVLRVQEDLAILKEVLHRGHAELPGRDTNAAGKIVPNPRARDVAVAARKVPDARAVIARWENEGGGPRPAHSSIELEPVKKLIVFDLDGTLAVSKASLDPETAALLDALLRVVEVVVISGGGWPLFEAQLLAQLSHDERL